MKIKNGWLILNGTFKCYGMFFEKNGIIPKMKIRTFNGEEGKIWAGPKDMKKGSNDHCWMEVWKDNLYVSKSGGFRYERVLTKEDKKKLLRDLKLVQQQYND